MDTQVALYCSYFLYGSFLDGQIWRRTANLLVDLVIIVTVCAVFGIISYLQFQNKDTEEATAVDPVIAETIVAEPIATETAEQETTVANTPEPVKDIEDITVSGNAASW